MNTTPTTHINTGGGSAFQGDFDNRGGLYVGRDLNVTFTAEQMQALLDQMLPLLRTEGVRVQEGQISVAGSSLAVNADQVEALGKYMADVAARDGVEREQRYLARLCVQDYQQWQTRYVILSGSYRVAPELTPAFSEIEVRGEGPQRQIERVALPDIRSALDRHTAFILLALPGAGKTTVLQRLALDQALARLQDPTAARMPLFARLSAQKSDETPHEFLARLWRQEMPAMASAGDGEFQRALQQGRLCILCDALNEARRERYQERVADWRDFAAGLPAGNRLVFTCRSQDYQGELKVKQVEIDPLSDEQIQDFARRYLDPKTGAAFWESLRTTHATLLPLARVPFYCRMMVEEFAQAGSLPPVRARLFSGFERRLLDREMEKRHPDWIEPAAQHWALAELAFAMQRLGAGTEVKHDWALDALPAQVDIPSQGLVATPPAAVLRLAHAASLLSIMPERSYKFSHHLLQEYFAAWELKRRHETGADLSEQWRVPSLAGEMPVAERGEWDPLPGPPPSGWEQTTILAAGLDPRLIAAVQAVNPALAARCLLESGLDWQNGEVEASQVESCRQTLLTRLGDVRIHLRSRIEAGLLLGRLKDPRFPLETVGGVRVILPPLVEIAAAETKIGSSLLDLGQAFADEFMRHKVPLAAYAIGRYPVTNAEYACFLAAGGYEEDRWWTAGGRYWLRGEPVPGEEDPMDWQMQRWRRWRNDPTQIDRMEKGGTMTPRDAAAWRQFVTVPESEALAQFEEWYPRGQQREPRYWQDQDFNNPSQPVVSVCWYEAMAYTRWLAALTGQPFRLPSEPEWEWAARHGGRVFPWGRGWNQERLNSLEGRVMRTTPVGAYPHGATPDGIHELSGNVWEWTATRYADYPYRPEANLEDPDATGLRVARGGGWTAHRRMVRCACRHRGDPRDWNSLLGYRIARSLE